jgi:hypothetical protein
MPTDSRTKRRPTPALTISVALTPGICRWCRCTYDTPCANGCSWVERSQTLCSECVPLDKALQTATGRRELAEFVQEGFLVGRQMPANARARR